MVGKKSRLPAVNTGPLIPSFPGPSVDEKPHLPLPWDRRETRELPQVFRPGTNLFHRAFLIAIPDAEMRERVHSAPGKAIVLSSAFSACRESSRVCCTTIGASDSNTLA